MSGAVPLPNLVRNSIFICPAAAVAHEERDSRSAFSACPPSAAPDDLAAAVIRISILVVLAEGRVLGVTTLQAFIVGHGRFLFAAFAGLAQQSARAPRRLLALAASRDAGVPGRLSLSAMLAASVPLLS
jgi:hypothetical protein